MTYAEKKRNRVAEMMRELEDDTDFENEATIIPLCERVRDEEGKPHSRMDAVVATIERLHVRREALLKASSIARSMLARAKSCGESYMLRKAAEEMKHEADRMGEEMVRKWIDEAMDDR